MTTIDMPPDLDPGISEPVVTTLPVREHVADWVPARRNIGRISRDDLMVLGGAAMSALCVDLLLFGRLTSMSGPVGFVLVGLVAFLGVYAFLVSRNNDRPAVIDRVMAALITASALLVAVALTSVVVHVLWEGRDALTKANFYTEDMSRTLPSDPLTKGGVLHGIFGTLIQVGIAVAITVPLGVTCAVYLNEYRTRFATLVRTVVTAMTALPSIVAGLFVFAAWVQVLGYQRCGLAASIAIAIMMLPIIIRSADVVLRLVPGNLREASAALGAPRWRSAWHVVLPTARSGLVTSVILGVARGAGETAPVLLTAGFTLNRNMDPTKNPMVSLPLLAYDFVRRPSPDMRARGFATAAVLMVLVLILFTLARVLGGKAAGQQSSRQMRRAEMRSSYDLERIAARGQAMHGRIAHGGGRTP